VSRRSPGAAPTKIDQPRAINTGPLGRYGTLAGPLTEPPKGEYRVRYVPLTKVGKHYGRSLFLVLLDLSVAVAMNVWLFQSDHFPEFPDNKMRYANLGLVICAALVSVVLLVNVITLCWATLAARNPIPVRPEPGKRIAVITTFVPDKESIDVLKKTLRRAKQIKYDGNVDVWLLDEGRDDPRRTPHIRLTSARYGVRYFSRRGVPEFNTKTGRFRAKTKHGNINAWFSLHGHEYDFIAGIDNDHVPQPNYLERMLGYFRDEDIAFVCGPQVYGNYHQGFVPRAAESMQFLFHGWLQRAANRAGCAMLVGTNNVIRVSALSSIGGLSDSITEDMATSIDLLTRRNAATGKRWRSVYTPDVVAVGEGPTTWSAFFAQQLRWARGTNEALMRQFFRRGWRFRPVQLFHYALLMSYYPSTAIAWILGAVSGILYLDVGAAGLRVSSSIWLMFFVNSALCQVGLYFFNRRHNTSPHEPEGSSGALGMLMAVLSTPIFVTALLGALLRRPSRFVITPKGVARQADNLWAFRRHIQWCVLFVGILVSAEYFDHAGAAYRRWIEACAIVCLTPIVICLVERLVPVIFRRSAKTEEPAVIDISGYETRRGERGEVLAPLYSVEERA
jgi:cellulose synthase/poly-beta-1,6-N-acetylglucosamine synthase-like glycosyltransferase